MKESGNHLGKYARTGIATVSLLAFSAISCSADNKNVPSEKAVNVAASSQPSGQVLRGDGFEIRKIGRNVLKLSGISQEKAVDYIAGKCEVENISPWELQGGTFSVEAKVLERVAVVQDDKCLPELTQ